jgi:trehalose synthase
MHNALQGAKRGLTEHERETYLTYSLRNANLLEEEYDLIFAHDPQPLAVPHFHGRGGARWVWRCHIDTSEPNAELWPFLSTFLDDYDAAVFTMKGFVPEGFPIGRVEIIPPAIDPESPKNIELPAKTSERILGWLGVEVDKPLVTHVSRFDPWKDQLGVVEAYRLIKEEMPQLRLALVGLMALDHPEGWEVYRQIQEVAREDPDIDIFTNLTGVRTSRSTPSSASPTRASRSLCAGDSAWSSPRPCGRAPRWSRAALVASLCRCLKAPAASWWDRSRNARRVCSACFDTPRRIRSWPSVAGSW